MNPLSTSWGLMKAGSDWCLFLPLGESPLNWAALMILLMEIIQGVNMMVIRVSSATGVMLEVIERVLEVGQVHQTTWI